MLPTSTVLGDPELDPGGQEVYQNTDFGDMSGDSDLYANVPRSQQTQKGLNGHHTHKQPYQNIGYDNSADAGGGGTEYQNIAFPGRGHHRKH